MIFRCTSWIYAATILICSCSPRVQYQTGSRTKSTADESTHIAKNATEPSVSRSTTQVLEDDVFVVILNRSVEPGSLFQLLAVSNRRIESEELVVNTNVVAVLQASNLVTGEIPYARLFTARAPERSGAYSVELRKRGYVSASGKALLTVCEDWARIELQYSGDSVWHSMQEWTAGWENVFAAWIAHLFRPLPGQPNKGWRALHQLLLNPDRNFLHNRLGYGEDEINGKHVVAKADCGDTPYILRAYFAWKFGLPFRYRRCSRGNSIKGPRCTIDVTNKTNAFAHVAHPVDRFNLFVQKNIAWQVHSGTMRTLPEDEESDFYPVALTKEAIRPGTVYVDVGGHALMVTSWDDEGLYAIDGHPDKTITRRRFSKRSFPFFAKTRTGGFKAFRPIRTENDRVIPVSNSALGTSFSIEQYRFSSAAAFYDHMSTLEKKGG